MPDLRNSFWLRFYYLGAPVVSLTPAQKDALEKFCHKLAQGMYSFQQATCLCGTNGGILVARRDRYALPVNTYLCVSCGVMRQSPRMTNEALLRFYQEDYRPIYVGSDQAPDNYFCRQIEHGRSIYGFVASSFNKKHNLSVFDVGCSAGGTLVPFVDAGWNAYGCDVGERYLQLGKKKGLVLEHGDASVLAKYGKADLVILSHVLEHLPNPEKSLSQISTIVADRGFVYIEFPGIFDLHKTYRDFLFFLQNAHLFHFTLATLVSLMSKCGFMLVKGDEHIRALFQKNGDPSRSIPTSDEYKKILAYLLFTEINRVSRKSGFPSWIRQGTGKIARKCLGDNLVRAFKARLGQPLR